MNASVEGILAQIEADLPAIMALVEALDPKAAATVRIATRLATIVASLLQTEAAIRARLDPELMQQIAQHNRDADKALSA